MTEGRPKEPPVAASEAAGPVAFVVAGRPPSANRNVGTRGARYQQHLSQLYRNAGGVASDEHRYGLVYYFVDHYRPEHDADIGNVPKRVWDALEGVAYADDQVVRLQVAGLIEFGDPGSTSADLAPLDLTDMPEAALRALLEEIDGGAAHLLYIELGLLQPGMYAVNLAAAQWSATT